MRLARPALALAAATVLILGLDASAAKKPVSWTDQAGDANGTDLLLLDSGLPAPLDKGISGPGTSAPRDVIKTEMANTWVKQGKKTVCTGFTVTATFSAPPTAADTIYRVSGDTENNPFFLIQHNTTDNTTDVRHGKAAQTDETTTALRLPAKVSGNKLIWTFGLKDIAAIDEKVGTVMTGLYSEISGSIEGMILLPVYDISYAPEDAAFTYCK